VTFKIDVLIVEETILFVTILFPVILFVEVIFHVVKVLIEAKLILATFIVELFEVSVTTLPTNTVDVFTVELFKIELFETNETTLPVNIVEVFTVEMFIVELFETRDTTLPSIIVATLITATFDSKFTMFAVTLAIKFLVVKKFEVAALVFNIWEFVVVLSKVIILAKDKSSKTSTLAYKAYRFAVLTFVEYTWSEYSVLVKEEPVLIYIRHV